MAPITRPPPVCVCRKEGPKTARAFQSSRIIFTCTHVLWRARAMAALTSAQACPRRTLSRLSTATSRAGRAHAWPCTLSV